MKRCRAPRGRGRNVRVYPPLRGLPPTRSLSRGQLSLRLPSEPLTAHPIAENNCGPDCRRSLPTVRQRLHVPTIRAGRAYRPFPNFAERVKATRRRRGQSPASQSAIRPTANRQWLCRREWNHHRQLRSSYHPHCTPAAS